MVSIVERSITGFKFEPILKKKRGKKILIGLKVEYLEDGELIAREIFKNINEVQVERLRFQLLDLIIINLCLRKNCTESKLLSRKNRRLGVVNMFKIDILKEYGNGRKDIRVEFLKNGYYFSESDFKGISEANLNKIRQILSDNTAHNFKIDKQCEAVDWLDLVAVIDGFVER